MSDMLLPVSIYLINSIASGIYTWNFLKGKYRKRTVLTAWSVFYFFIQIGIFEELSDRFSVSDASGIILNICVLLFMQFLFFTKDMQKQLFVAVSFVAGKETVKYIVSVFNIALNGLCNKTLNYFITTEILNTLGKTHIWVKVLGFTVIILCALLYALLLSMFLLLISRKFVKKDYLLKTHENVFLILPCIAALSISVTIKMMIISVENGMTVIIYDTVPATKFWIPIICVLLLSAIIASVILFQKLVQYNEEAGKRAMLENQVRQMQKEIVEIQDIYTDMRGLRHDMRSHLANISLLVKSMAGSVNEELESYIGKMEETVSKLDFAYPPKLLIDVYDVAVILNNALENAIETCGKAEGEKQIKLHSYVKGSLFFIEVENDFCGEIVMEEGTGLPVSSKETGKPYGIGISNIQRCAKKYMGDIDIVISDTGGRKKFSLTVMMNGKTAAAI